MPNPEQNGLSNQHGLQPPSKGQALAALGRFLNTAEAERTWENLCQESGLIPNAEELMDLEVIFKCMSNKPGPIGVTGKALLVRLISYRILSKTAKVK